MRKVVDSNALQSAALRDYLSKSIHNFAVLTDYAAMEAYKGDTLVSIFKSMEILTEFPSQVIVLKSTGVVCGLRGRRARLQRRMIDAEQSHGFQDYCRHLRATERGDVSLREQLLNHGRAADTQIDRMLADAAIIPDAVKGIEKTFTTTELKIIRTDSPFPSPLIRKLLENVAVLAQSLFFAASPSYDRA